MIGIREILSYLAMRKLKLRAGQIADLLRNPHVTVYPQPISFSAKGGGQRRIVVLTPHADDETFGAGGTRLRHLAHGDDVRVLLFSDNVASVARGEDRRDEVIGLREQEFAEAMHILGVTEWSALRLGNSAFDERVYPGHAFSDLIENHPDVLYLPSLFDNHHDHRVLNAWLLRTLENHPAMRLVIRGYEVWTPLPATVVADISGQMERKRDAMRCYRSQIDVIDYPHHIEGLNAYRAMTLGGRSARHAEAFLELSAPAYLEIGKSLLFS